MAYACPEAPATVIRSPLALLKVFFDCAIFWIIHVFVGWFYLNKFILFYDG